jgi:hypothetical protein
MCGQRIVESSHDPGEHQHERGQRERQAERAVPMVELGGRVSDSEGRKSA